MSAVPLTRLDFRLPVECKRQIERAASVQGRTLTEFAIDTLTRAARSVLEEHEAVRLSERDRQRFLAMLEADPAPNARLLAAAKRHRQIVKT
jgi:uncharacterized protein (DUF1778 family)